jgi:uncharacterized Fe-S radical SAM superfamily protein PflX
MIFLYRRRAAKMDILMKYVSCGEESFISGGGGICIVYPAARCGLSCKYCWLNGVSLKAEQTTPLDLVTWVLVKNRKAPLAGLEYCGVPDNVQARIVYRLLRRSGLNFPVIFKGSGIESKETLAQEKGRWFDIYLPDFKFALPDLAGRLCGLYDYPERCLETLNTAAALMPENEYRDGLLCSGVAVRHLILPGLTENTAAVLEMFAAFARKYGWPLHLSPDYAPLAGKNEGFPSLGRLSGDDEYNKAAALANELCIRLS